MRDLEKLLNQFQDTPRNIILHADILRRGVKPTEDLANAGERSCITGISTKLQGLLGETKPSPSMFHFEEDETSVDIKLDLNSPYEIRKSDGDDSYELFCGDESFGKIHFTDRPSYTDKETQDGSSCATMLLQRGPHCIMVNPLQFCAYFSKGDACKYCVLSAAMDVGVKAKLTKAVPDPATIAEAVALAKQDIALKDLKICGGALYDTKKEAQFYKRCLEAIVERNGAPEEIQIFSQAFDEEDQRDLKSLGATNVLFNLEIWNEELWPELLPGKARAIGRQEWIDRLTTAVDVFGRGHVGCGFVGGFECAPRPGFLSQEEAFKSYLEAFEVLIERGIVPWFTVWTAVPFVGGFGVDDPPATEFYLRLGQELHELLEKHGVYPDLGFPSMGVDPPTLGMYCYYCFSMTFSRDYPRLIDRAKAA